MKLKKYLLEKEIKITTIAQKTGIDISRISKHLAESSKLPMKHIEKVAKYLGLTVEEVKLNKVEMKSLGVDV